jgi:hypothetical protein
MIVATTVACKLAVVFAAPLTHLDDRQMVHEAGQVERCVALLVAGPQ